MSGASRISWRLEATYASLPEAFWAHARPAPFPNPALVIWNEPLAAATGLDATGIARDELARFATGQSLPPSAAPIAQAYAGHQYGHATMLGDGRAILVGELRTPSGALADIQYKGSGPTRFSRRGDGRAALGPMLREFLVSEAMHALGIPTTRSLSVATTGERIARDGPKPGAVLVRMAASHLRVGTFEYGAALGDDRLLRELCDYAIRRHDADLAREPGRVVRFLARVVERQAALVARWQCVGFVHGVMNTDNTTISGETIDYGPCAFLDAYDPDAVFSSIDRFGRYRFGAQPEIVHWNLARFAESLVAILDDDRDRAIDAANEALARFPVLFEAAWLDGMRAKLGLAGAPAEDGDRALVEELLAAMQAARADFTGTFRALAEGQGAGDVVDARKVFESSNARVELNAREALRPLEPWLPRWSARLARAGRSADDARRAMLATNPAIIPRNHRVEEALAAAEQGELAPLEALLAALGRPFAPTAADARFREPAPADFCGYRTFCGT